MAADAGEALQRLSPFGRPDLGLVVDVIMPIKLLQAMFFIIDTA